MANYLDPTQRREIEALAQRFTAKTEWPTWLLLIGVYTGWFAVILGIHWLGLIATELSRLDPENAATYSANAAAATATITAAEAEAATLLAPHDHAEIAVFHDAYGYFIAPFGLHPAHAISLGDASAPGAKRLADLRGQIEADGITCIFPEAGHDPALVGQLADGTKARIGAELDPEGRMIDVGPGLYPAIITGMARTISDCLKG